MKVLFLTGGTEDPATRFRVYPFFPHLEAAGIRCVHHGAYDHRYNALLHTPLINPYKAAWRSKRALYTVLNAHRFDAVFLQRTAYPKRIWPELFAGRVNRRLVFDFDDAVFLAPSGERDAGIRASFDRIVATSARVIAGNGFLAQAADAPAKTLVIPTVIDTDAYTPGNPAPMGEHTVIGWMGTSSNFASLASVTGPVSRLLEGNPALRFRIVSNGVLRELERHPQVQHARWDEATELAELRSFDVGIMPLEDTEWNRGKCGFKMIQYMSVGRPVVVSAVGANVEILQGSGGGFLVRGGPEWYDALSRLVADPALRAAMGSAGRARVVESYSVQGVAQKYVSLFHELQSTPRTAAPRAASGGAGQVRGGDA